MIKANITTNPDFLWGRLYEPTSPKASVKGGIRTVVFGSTTAGNLVINTLAKLESRHPGMINLVAAATDDPLDPATQISVKKRIWNQYTPPEMQRLHDMVAESCLQAGIPCYTGGIKTDAFRAMFRSWNPELVLVCCFGQLIDRVLFEYPVEGMYNFHPSDLAANIGAGPRPFELTISQGRTTSRMILHRVNEIIDGGPIVGSSPPINICRTDGKYPDSLLTLQEKIPSICGWMSTELVHTLYNRKAMGIKALIERIDFESSMPEEILALLMKPAENDPEAKYNLPDHPLLA